MIWHARKFSIMLTLAVSAALLTAAPGCETPAEPHTLVHLASPAVQSRLAGEYWSNHSVPEFSLANVQRVAIAEFSVEFVTGKIESPAPGDTADPNPPTDTANLPEPAGSITESDPPADPASDADTDSEAGAQSELAFETIATPARPEPIETYLDYPPHVQEKLTDQLYAMLVVELLARGIEVIPRETLRATDAYQRLQTQKYSEATLVDEPNLTSSDTGRITKVAVRPATGLRLITGAAGEPVEAVEADLLNELAADAVIRARIRVGVTQGRAAVERGSTVWVLTRDSAGNLTADRSLISEGSVIDDNQTDPATSRGLAIHGDRFAKAIRSLFPPYLAMAFEAGHGD